MQNVECYRCEYENESARERTRAHEEWLLYREGMERDKDPGY
jgi:hypothetical protein